VKNKEKESQIKYGKKYMCMFQLRSVRNC